VTAVRWRWPLALSAGLLLAQLLPLHPLVDAATGAPPVGLHLAFPVAHVVLAPLTLLADWLNGSPARELEGFGLWCLAGFVVVRCLRARRVPIPWRARARRELIAAALAVAALAAFVAWGVWGPRPIPRLVATDFARLVVDVHSHTAASHDGRPGFDAAANAAWHARAGFDAAFVTDHNTGAASRAWRTTGARGPARLLPGIELSLSGLHLLALGSDDDVPNAVARGSWEATGRLVRTLAGSDGGRAAPLLVASLPEYWRYRWGDGVDSLVAWGVRGLEVWTTSPRAMDFPAALRRDVVARARRDGLVLLGSTDMHGIGASASVWNVVSLPGWSAMDDATLTAALLARWREGGADANQVVVRRRWLPASRAGAGVAVPANGVVVLRTASPAHALALLAWLWLPALLSARRRPAPRS
jgi:hypothetical protein